MNRLDKIAARAEIIVMIAVFILPVTLYGYSEFDARYAADTHFDDEEDVFLPVWAALKAKVPDVALTELKRLKDTKEVKRPKYWFYLGTALREKDRYEEAAEAFLQGLGEKNNKKTKNKVRNPVLSGRLYNGLGFTYMKMGETEKALDCLNIAIEMDPSKGEYYNDLGKVFLLRNEVDRGIAAFTTAYRMSSSPDVVKDLAFAYGMKREYGKAKEILMTAFPIYEVYYNLGLIYEMNGDVKESLGMYEMSLMAKREYEPAMNKLKNINLRGDR
jgi:tetratricopeptide (TPR) repeat protein